MSEAHKNAVTKDERVTLAALAEKWERWQRDGAKRGCPSTNGLSAAIADVRAALAASAQASAVDGAEQKPVATVRVTAKGYAMELSTYVMYGLPEGMHDLYAAPLTPVAATVPEGWKLVPVKPTEEMVRAACLEQSNASFANYEAWHDSHSSGISARIRQLVARDYRAMLAASPAAESKAATVPFALTHKQVIETAVAHALSGKPVDPCDCVACVKMRGHQYGEIPAAESKTLPRESDAAAATLDPQELLEIARATGLRSFLHGVNAENAREILEAYQVAVETRRAAIDAHLSSASAQADEALTQDAERYRWLRLHRLFPSTSTFINPPELDAAIDAARAKDRK